MEGGNNAFVYVILVIIYLLVGLRSFNKDEEAKKKAENKKEKPAENKGAGSPYPIEGGSIPQRPRSAVQQRPGHSINPGYPMGNIALAPARVKTKKPGFFSRKNKLKKERR